MFNKLKAWHDLDFGEFLKELEKARGISTEYAAFIGAASLSGNQPIMISDETANQIGQGFEDAIKGWQIRNAKIRIQKAREGINYLGNGKYELMKF